MTFFYNGNNFLKQNKTMRKVLLDMGNANRTAQLLDDEAAI